MSKKEQSTLDKLGDNALSEVAKRFFDFPSSRVVMGNPLHSPEVNQLTSLVHEAVVGIDSEVVQYDPVEKFEQALALRDELLDNPEIQGDERARQYVEGIVALTEDEDPEESLRLTRDLYSENIIGNLPDVESHLNLIDTLRR